MKSGIYAIKNTMTGKVYIGSAVLFSRRFAQHRSELSRGTHHSIKLQRAWAKHGASAFVFEVIEHIADVTDLVAREQHWIDVFGSAGVKGYNVLTVAGSSLGYQHTDEAKKKMLGRDFIAEHRAKIAANSRGRVTSEETKRKLSTIFKGRKFSDESIENMKRGMVGRKMAERSPEHRAKHAEALRGQKRSIESIAKMTGQKHSAERVAKRVATRAANRALKLSEAAQA